VRERHLLQSHIQKHENVINQPRPVCGVATIGCQSEACGGALTRRWKAGRKERALEAQERRQRQTEAARRRERTSRRERMVAMTAAGSAESIAGGETGSIGSGGEGGDMVVDGGEVVGEKRWRFFEPETEPWLLRGSFLSDQQGPAHRMVRYGGCACGAAVRWAW
jgi:hypothetical protein